MSTFKGVNRTKLDTPNSGNIIPVGQNHGNLHVMYDTYELSATADGSVIQLGDLIPAGATIHNIIVMSDALGSGTTIAIGDAASAARYVAAYSTVSSVKKSLIADGVIDSNGYVIGTASGDNQIQATLAGGAGTGTLFAWIVYSL